MAEKLPGMFQRDKKICPQFFTWPAETVTLESGESHEDIFVLELERVPTNDWSATLRQAVAVSKAYGLLLVEQKAETVKAIFESHHGSRAWTFPIRRHGDVKILLSPKVTTDLESVGILWSPARASA